MGACVVMTDINISSGLDSNATGITAFSMPGWQLALWTAAYLALVLVAVMGNATVIWIILAHQRMRTVTNYFIVNLALADLCMAAFNAAFNFVYASHNIWYFGRAFCYFQNLFPITAMFVSIYSMTAIAADRYMAIVHPFQPRLSAPGTRAVIAGIWLVALALAFPQCFYSTITTDEGATKCVVAWPEDSGGKMLLLYHLIVIALIYFLPLVVMFVAYSVIGLTLWRRSVPGHQAHGANLRHLQAKKKVNSGGGGDGVRAGPEVWPRLGIGHSGPTPKRAPRSIDSAFREDHGAGGGDVCHLLAALPPLLHPGHLPGGHLLPQVHPAGLPGALLAGHELHHVQSHHLLLPQPQVSLWIPACFPLLSMGHTNRGGQDGADLHSIPLHEGQQILYH
uniref:Substance-K receptor n=1 Tax=Bos indicus x Bos taurus TaxID=30522 RepID=A0A4W2HXF8_BOBOX